MKKYNIGSNQESILKNPSIIDKISIGMKQSLRMTLNELTPSIGKSLNKPKTQSFKVGSNNVQYKYTSPKETINKALNNLSGEDYNKSTSKEITIDKNIKKVSNWNDIPKSDKEESNSNAKIYNNEVNNLMITNTNMSHIKNAFSAMSKNIISFNNKQYSAINVSMNRLVSIKIDNDLRYYNQMTNELNNVNNYLNRIDNYMSNVSSITSGGIGINITSKQISSLVNSTTMLSMDYYKDALFNDSKDEMGKEVNKLVRGMSKVMVSILHPQLKKTLDETNRIFESLPVLLNTRFKNMSNSDNPLANYLGNKFYKETNTRNNYNKGIVAWDGVTRRAVINTIPGILSKIESTIKNGNPNDEKVYDYIENGWRTKDGIIKMSKKQFTESLLAEDNGIDKLKNLVMEELGNKSKKPILDQAIYTMVMDKDIPGKNKKFSKDDSVNKAIYNAWLKMSSKDKNILISSVVNIKTPNEWISDNESYHNVDDILGTRDLFTDEKDFEKEFEKYLLKNGNAKLARMFGKREFPGKELGVYNPMKYVVQGIAIMNKTFTDILVGDFNYKNISSFLKMKTSDKLDRVKETFSNSSIVNEIKNDVKDTNISKAFKNYLNELIEVLGDKSKGLSSLIDEKVVNPIKNISNRYLLKPINTGISKISNYFSNIVNRIKDNISEENPDSNIYAGLGMVVSNKIFNSTSNENIKKNTNIGINDLIIKNNYNIMRIYDTNVIIPLKVYSEELYNSDYLDKGISLLDTPNSRMYFRRINRYLKRMVNKKDIPEDPKKKKNSKSIKNNFKKYIDRKIDEIKYYTNPKNFSEIIKNYIDGTKNKFNKRLRRAKFMYKLLFSRKKNHYFRRLKNGIKEGFQGVFDGLGGCIKSASKNVSNTFKNVFKIGGQLLFKTLPTTLRNLNREYKITKRILFKNTWSVLETTISTVKEQFSLIKETKNSLDFTVNNKEGSSKEHKTLRARFNIIGGNIDGFNNKIKVQYEDISTGFDKARAKFNLEDLDDEKDIDKVNSLAGKSRSLISKRISDRQQRLRDMMNTITEAISDKLFEGGSGGIISGIFGRRNFDMLSSDMLKNATPVYIVGGHLDGVGSSGGGSGIDLMDVVDGVDTAKDIGKTLKNSKGLLNTIKGIKNIKNLGSLATAGGILASGGSLLLPLAGMWLTDRAFKGIEGWMNAEENFGVEKATLGMKASSAVGTFFDSILPGDQSKAVQAIYNGGKNIGGLMKSLGGIFTAPAKGIINGFRSIFSPFSNDKSVETAKEDAKQQTRAISDYNKELDNSNPSNISKEMEKSVLGGAKTLGTIVMSASAPVLGMGYKAFTQTETFKSMNRSLENKFIEKLNANEREEFLSNRNASVYGSILNGQSAGKLIRTVLSTGLLGENVFNGNLAPGMISLTQFNQLLVGLIGKNGELLANANNRGTTAGGDSSTAIPGGGTVIGGTPSAAGFVWPVPQSLKITSPFGYRTHPISGTKKMHSGIDIAGDGKRGANGYPIVAAKAGIVTHAAPLSSYGNLIKIDHGGGVETRYAHIDNGYMMVKVGQQVQAGQQIATIGSSGGSTGPHLHFEVRTNNTAVDPTQYVSNSSSASTASNGTPVNTSRSIVRPTKQETDMNKSGLEEVADPKFDLNNRPQTERSVSPEIVKATPANMSNKECEDCEISSENPNSVGYLMEMADVARSMIKEVTPVKVKADVKAKTQYDNINEKLTVARNCPTYNQPKVSVLSAMVNLFDKLNQHTEDYIDKDLEIPEINKDNTNNSLINDAVKDDFDSTRIIDDRILKIARGCF